MRQEMKEFDKLLESKEYVQSIIGSFEPKIGIVCGSGLGHICNILKNPITVSYKSIPHFPESTVVGHSGELVFGEIDNIPIVCMKGRIHLYEGYDVTQCIRPIRLMKLLGIKVICVTNAAGNVNKKFKPGDFMILKDHISFPSLSGENPLRGPHDSRLGERFVTMSNAYDTTLINTLMDASVATGLEECVRKGTYAMVVGPTYETVAEAKALKILGADAVGMSTVHEIIAAHQMGVRCIGISLLTNDVLTEYDSTESIVEHGDVVQMGKERAGQFIGLVTKFIQLVSRDEKFELIRETVHATNGNDNKQSVKIINAH